MLTMERPYSSIERENRHGRGQKQGDARTFKTILQGKKERLNCISRHTTPLKFVLGG